MTLRERARRAGRVLASFLTDHQHRQDYARRNRALVIKGLQQGVNVDVPRSRWIRHEAALVLAQVRQAAEEYNNRYPWDIITADDLHDVLNNALQTLREATKED